MVSIIISFYERLHHLRLCLDSLNWNREDFDEVLIADDGSSEVTVRGIEELIVGYDFPVRHVWQPKKGFRLAASRNNAIRKSRGDYLVFLDTDFVVLPDAIRHHREAAAPGIFVAALCKYLDHSQTERLFSEGLSSESLQALYRQLPEKPLKREHFRFVKYELLIRLRLAGARKQRCSSHFSIHRKDMEAINGYDENFVGWGGEDEDLALRMVKAGFRGRSIIPQARTLHLWHPKELGNRHWQEGCNVAYLNRKSVSFRCEKGLRRQEP
ncbi:MAG: glycosyltransferase [Desulfobacterales bacterium]|jgi:glycosyltransferase involved in cell wall biosynthesis